MRAPTRRWSVRAGAGWLFVLAAAPGSGPAAPQPTASGLTQATRELTVWVADPDRRPVVGAGVEVLSGYRPIAAGVTDEEGKAVASVPVDAAVQWVLALKPGVGFGYAGCDPAAENVVESYPPAVRGADLDGVVLTLSEGRTIRITAVDESDQPLSGVRLVPWIVEATGGDAINLSGSLLASVVTDDDGTATFDWLPVGAAQGVGGTFLVQGGQYHWPHPAQHVLGRAGSWKVTAHLVQKQEIRGRVRFPDGTPAAGIGLLAQGRGETVHFGRGEGTTDAEGLFSIAVAPDQVYTVAVIDAEWAGRIDGVRVARGSPVESVDMQLTRGAIIEASIVSWEGAPVRAECVYLLFEDPGSPDVLRLAEDPYWRDFASVSLQQTLLTDAEGRVGFRVAPGRYQICTPSAVVRGQDRHEGDVHRPVDVQIQDAAPADIEIEFVQRRSEPLAASLAPAKADTAHVYEFAFQPAETPDGDWSCRQCHRAPWRNRSFPRAHGWE